MKVNTSKFITKSPVETEYGTFRFLTIEEYIDYQESLSMLSLGTLNLYYSYKKVIGKPTDEEVLFLKTLKDTPLRQVVIQDMSLLKYYVSIIDKVMVFKENFDIEYVFSTDEIFMEVRKIIMDMNLVKEEKAFYNEELQEGIERSKMLNSNKGEIQTPEDIITCIVAFTSNSFEDVLGMSVYQAYAIYSRIGAGKNYDTGVLFATVSGDAKIEGWNKHINLLAEEKVKDMKREAVLGKDFG